MVRDGCARFVRAYRRELDARRSGLRFDRFEFSYTLKSSAACTWDAGECIDSGTNGTNTLSSVLPIFGAPEYKDAAGFTYTAAVPEPATTTLTLLGLVPVGLAAFLRRRRGQSVAAL